MVRKGMSLEEKRQAILSVYHERKEPLNLKEIEKHGAAKGVRAQPTSPSTGAAATGPTSPWWSRSGAGTSRRAATARRPRTQRHHGSVRNFTKHSEALCFHRKIHEGRLHPCPDFRQPLYISVSAALSLHHQTLFELK